MRILISESRSYNPAALEIYRDLGELECADVQDRMTLLDMLQDVDILVVRLRHTIDAEVMDVARRLRVVVSPTTGLDHIDLAEAEARGIAVLSLRGETAFLQGITATAELAWALILELARRVGSAHHDVVRGRWDRDRWKGRSLASRTLGLLGFGRIGRIVSEYGVAFRMPVIAHDPEAQDYPSHVRPVTLAELLAEADVLSIHVVLDEATTGLLGGQQIARMKRGAWLVNTARGAVVDESSLVQALVSGQLGGAALDVRTHERTTDSTWLLRDPLRLYAETHDNLILTPHIGGATLEAMAATEIHMAERTRHFVRTRAPHGSS